jgi:predicted AAA+ superfamily ATPase
MPHLRARFIQKSLLHKIKQWRVTALFGPRQSGKSTLLRELLFKTHPVSYVILDKTATQRQARANPEYFLTQFQSFPIILDEVHKAPELFDEIKSWVDLKSRPGQFILTGSVEFSQKIGIRESLTGRVGSIYMDSMTLKETQDSKKDRPTLTELHQYLSKGGMPGVCFSRDSSVQAEYWDQWIETTCEKDIKMFSKGKLSSRIANDILFALGEIGPCDLATLRSKIRTDVRRIQNHIEALIDLFVIREVFSGHSGIGKSIYVLFDCGLAKFLKSDSSARIRTYFYHHILNGRRFLKNANKLQLTTYRTRGGVWVDFVEENKFHILSETTGPDRYQLKTAAAIIKRFPKSEVHYWCLTDSPTVQLEKQVYSNSLCDL